MANHDPNEALVYTVRAIERVEERIAALAARVEEHLTHKRKTPSSRVRAVHVAAIGAMGGACPFCNEPLFDEGGAFVGVVHHVDRASDASIEATMPTCAGCNSRFNQQPAPRAVVDAYHLRRARLRGPLFERGRRGR